MNLDTLEQLADAAWEKGCATEVHLGYTGDKAGTYAVQMENRVLKELIALCRMQNDALSAIYIYRHGQKIVDWERIDEALAAYEQLNSGETK